MAASSRHDAAWAHVPGAPVLARLMAAHADSEGRLEAQKSNWSKVEAPAVEAQMNALEETIAVLEREMKTAAAALAKAESEERSGGLSSVGTPADLELKLGTLEDKLLLTTQQLEELRRLSYFPAVEGYQLRFSYKDTFLGFKELLLEQLSGALTLSITPGVGDKGQESRVPTVMVRLAGSTSSSGSKGMAEYGDGALLRFRGEGVSLVSRREMLGVSLTPNFSLHRMDVSVRFAATIPLVYHPRRRAWRPDAGFKIELLHDRSKKGEASFGGAPEQLLRVLLQSLVEGIMKTFAHRQLGPHLGDYLRGAPEGVELEMELSVVGTPVRTFDCELGSWAAGKLETYAEERAAAVAARTIGLTGEQLRALTQVEQLVPSMLGGGFGSIGSMLTYFHAAALAHDVPRRVALATLWQEALDQSLAQPLAGRPLSGRTDSQRSDGSQCSEESQCTESQGGESMRTDSERGERRSVEHGRVDSSATCDERSRRSTEHSGSVLDMARLFERLSALLRKPVRLSIRFRRVRLGLVLERALSAGCAASAASLARSGAEHSSARTLLNTFRDDCLNALGAVARNLRVASSVLSGSLQGGTKGYFHSILRHLGIESTWSLSQLISPPAAKPYQLQASVLPDGRLQLLLSLVPAVQRTRSGGGAEAEAEAAAGAEAQATPPDGSSNLARSPSRLTPSRPTSALQLLAIHIAQLTASVMAGPYEALRVNLLQLASSHLVPPDPPDLPPIPASQPAVKDVGAPPPPKTPPMLPLTGKPPSASSPNTRLVDVFENQRRLTVLRPYSAADLLPLDPAPWSDETFSRRFAEMNLVPLPTDREVTGERPLPPPVEKKPSLGAALTMLQWQKPSDKSIHLPWQKPGDERSKPKQPTRSQGAVPKINEGLAPPAVACGAGSSAGSSVSGKSAEAVSLGEGDEPASSWRWVSEWHVDMTGGNKSDEGWQYAWNWNTGWLSSSNPITHVRRRRWVRYAERVASGPCPAVGAAALLSERAKAVEMLLEGSTEPRDPPRAEASSPAPPSRGSPHKTASPVVGSPVVGSPSGLASPSQLASPSAMSPTQQLSPPRLASPPRHASPSPASPTPSSPIMTPSMTPSTTPSMTPARGEQRAPRFSFINADTYLGTPFLSGGAALFQVTIAEGACVRLKAHHVETTAQPALLFDHLTSLLQEQLATHPWYAEPLRVAAERARKHLGLECLRVAWALKVELKVFEGECYMTVEGVPGAMDPTDDEPAHAVDSPEAAGVCATFVNDINLLDFVADVRDIYSSFVTNSVLIQEDKMLSTTAKR